MINLILINKKIYNKFLIIFFCIILNNAVTGSENKIIFKINGNAFTLLDLEKRIEYIDFVGSNQNLNVEVIKNDYISANLFYEYFKNTNNKNDYSLKFEEIYNNIINTNIQNNKKYSYEINKSNILRNIKIDFIRKVILENILNNNVSNFNKNLDEIDLLYNLNIKYINFNTQKIDKIKNEIDSLEDVNFEIIQKILNKYNVDYFIKENEIDDINIIDKRIKENIISNNNFFFFENNNNYISIIFIEKSFETLNGIIAKLYSVRSKKNLDNEYLSCENLIEIKNNPRILNKEYKLIDLNNDLKNNLLNINDYVKFSDNDEIVYIVLCEIKFDKEILNNMHFNKQVNTSVYEIEKNFINKYSKFFNLIEFNE